MPTPCVRRWASHFSVPAVLIAAYLVTSMPLYYVRWLVVGVVIIAATMMLRSAAKGE